MKTLHRHAPICDRYRLEGVHISGFRNIRGGTLWMGLFSTRWRHTYLLTNTVLLWILTLACDIDIAIAIALYDPFV